MPPLLMLSPRLGDLLLTWSSRCLLKAEKGFQKKRGNGFSQPLKSLDFTWIRGLPEYWQATFLGPA